MQSVLQLSIVRLKHLNVKPNSVLANDVQIHQCAQVKIAFGINADKEKWVILAFLTQNVPKVQSVQVNVRLHLKLKLLLDKRYVQTQVLSLVHVTQQFIRVPTHFYVQIKLLVMNMMNRHK